MRPELDHWPDETEAARRLGIAPRTLRDWELRGKAPERRMRPRPGGGKPVACYDPDQIENILAERDTQVLAPGDPRLPRPGRPIELAPAPMMRSELLPLAEAIRELGAAIMTRVIAPPAPPEPPKDYGTPEEMGRSIGLPGAVIRRGIRAGVVPAVRGAKGFIVSRAHLADPATFGKLAGLRQEIRDVLKSREAARA